MKKYLSMLLILVLVLIMAGGCSNQQPAPSSLSSEQTGEADPSGLKVAVLLNGTITDGWSSSAYEGIQLIQETYGCETSYIESVSKQDMEAVLRNYASEGYDVIFGHGSEFADAIKAVAPEFTDTIFVINSYTEAAEPNISTISLNNYEQGFLVGIVAATCSETGTVAAMNASESDSIKASLDGQRAALSYLRPEMELVESWTGDADDATKAYEMALTLIRDGADIIVSDPGQMAQGILQACEETGALAIGVVGDLAALNPDVVITSARSSYGKAMVALVDEVIQGTWEPKCYDSGIAEDAVFIEPFGPNMLTEEQSNEINQAIDKVKSGEIDVKALINA